MKKLLLGLVGLGLVAAGIAATPARAETDPAAQKVSVKLVVTDSRLQPVYGAKVRLNGETKLTNEKGEATFEDLSPSILPATIEYFGLVSTQTVVVHTNDFGNTQTVYVTARTNAITGMNKLVLGMGLLAAAITVIGMAWVWTHEKDSLLGDDEDGFDGSPNEAKSNG